MEITVKIEAPELAAAITRLADALAARTSVQSTPAEAPAIVPTEPAEAPAAEPEKPKRTRKTKAAEAPQEAAPAPAPAEDPAPTEQAWETVADHPAAADIAAEAKGAPSIGELANAGAALLDKNPDAMQPLLDLLSDYGVQAITYLRDDQLAGFAERLRALGAEV